MKKRFEEIESQFQELKKKFKQKKISEREFRYQLRKLRIDDPGGKCWTIGARSGKWYYFDGDKWIESDPPSFQKEKIVCPHCGFENDIRSEACEYCGARLDAKQEADDFIQTEWKEVDDLKELKEPEEVKIQKKEEKSLPIEDLNESNYVARFINPSSFLVFSGLLGFIVGLVGGAVVGATSLFSEFVLTLPSFFSTLQGKIHGGFLFGLLGGISGFILFSLAGFLTAVFVNMILSLTGGIKLRIDKI
jgi:hypothetical protein